MSRAYIGVLAAACLSLAAVAAEDTALQLDGAWVRALPPNKTNTAAYLTLSNRGDNAIAIVGASADLADRVEIHTTREIEGYLRMEQLQGLALAPGEQIELVPGGIHLMLLGLDYMPKPGEIVRLCLQLASGDEVCTEAGARKSTPVAGAQDHRHH